MGKFIKKYGHVLDSSQNPSIFELSYELLCETVHELQEKDAEIIRLKEENEHVRAVGKDIAETAPDIASYSTQSMQKLCATVCEGVAKIEDEATALICERLIRALPLEPGKTTPGPSAKASARVEDGE